VELAGRVAGQPEGTEREKQVGIERRQSHGEHGAAASLVGLANEAEGRAAAGPRERRVRTGGDRSLEERERPVVVVEDESPNVPRECQGPRVERITLDRRRG